MGLSLTAGFLTMVLIEEAMASYFRSRQPEDYAQLPGRESMKQVQVTTLGMCIHGLAGGLAIAASLSSKFLFSDVIFCQVGLFGGNSLVGLIVLLALSFHKIPEATGYGLFLEQQRCPTSLATRNLLVSLINTFVNSTPV